MPRACIKQWMLIIFRSLRSGALQDQMVKHLRDSNKVRKRTSGSFN